MAVLARTTRLYGPTELPSSVTAIYTVPADTAVLIKSIIVASNGAASSFSLRVNGTGGGKLLFNALASPAAGSQLVLLPDLHLNAGDVLYADAAVANRVVMTISGFKYT